MLAAVFVALNLVGLRAWRDASAAQRTAIQQARSAADEQKAWLLAAEAIPERLRNPGSPPPLSEKDASSELIGLVRSTAQQHGLTILEESLPPPPPGLPERAAAARVKLSGPFAGVVRLLFDLQKPGQWRSVEQLILKADATPQNVLAEMEVRQYYSQTSEGANP
ncbi:MAG: hypothetical protein N2322_06180 [Terrimicrobiaceae bacterium]|nr:hypothetical protein [Terrimicrobiaceae bacterium]